MHDLSGKTAIVTGGLSGMGLAIATALAQAGASVGVGSRSVTGNDDPAHQDALKQIRASGQAVHACRLDVTDHASIDGFISTIKRTIGDIDIVVNAAGMTHEQPVCGHSDTLWNSIIETNLTGAFRMTRAVLPEMIANGFGRVINIGSTAASVGWADNPAYCASKAGLLGLTRCVALEGAASGVTCVMVSPTWVETDLMRNDVKEIVAREGKGRSIEQAMADITAENPQGRIIQPDEIAALVTFLCSDAARGLTMENIQVSGGSLW
ncbi:short-chain dehydrogenase/reductase family protein [Octadecabacter arcticus 238]|uniref:Short-chain dehydrogenase/reductase family protein n=1 Tax=Octadecabacter arcticus 238 TaxID=391616 RepID=M9RQB3_9RHOB|nr:SDR family NAD(P)-dependent oxidoreductase [Octadecabacter arcticus]AGI74367.1 short-chain dehydrogenase/reductase family protein [Octadecabacter arcticus 238]